MISGIAVGGFGFCKGRLGVDRVQAHKPIVETFVGFSFSGSTCLV